MERVLFCSSCALHRVADSILCPECSKPLEVPESHEERSLVNVSPTANLLRDAKRIADMQYRVDTRRRIV